MAAGFESKALVAGAALAQGRVRLAEGDTADARRHFEAAAHLWSEIGAPYEAALARTGLARAHRAEGNEARALLEFRAARAAFERIGAASEEARAAQAIGETPGGDLTPSPLQAGPPVASNVRVHPDNMFRREGDYWSVVFEGHIVRLRDVRGLRYLARLLANPGREFHVLDLVAVEPRGAAGGSRGAEQGVPFRDAGDAGELLDGRAKDAYRRRLAEIEDDLEEARELGDAARAAQANAEREFLVSELSRAVGLGGRDRRAGSAAERARASVTRAVRQAMKRIREHDPELGAHLDRTIRTGTYCAYLPGTRSTAAWKL